MECEDTYYSNEHLQMNYCLCFTFYIFRRNQYAKNTEIVFYSFPTDGICCFCTVPMQMLFGTGAQVLDHVINTADVFILGQSMLKMYAIGVLSA